MSLTVTPVTDLDTLTLVPPQRLGRLLAEARLARRSSLAALSLAGGGVFSPEELAAVEAGRFELSDADVARLAATYGVEAHALLPQRTRLVIDLHEGHVTAGGVRVPALRTGGRATGRDAADRRLGRAVDDVLTRYLGLVYGLRGLSPGVPLALRHDDLEVLAEALGRTVSDVERRLAGLMADPGDRVTRRIRHLLVRLVVPEAGILVATVAAAALVLEPGGGHLPPPGEEQPEVVDRGLVLSLARRTDLLDGEVSDDTYGTAVPAARTATA